MHKILRYLFRIPSLLFNRFVFLYRKVTYKDFPKIFGILSVRGNGELSLGYNVKIISSFNSNPVGLGYKTAFHIAPNAEIIIGNNVGISNTLLYAEQKIIVEDNVLIGGGCQILDSDFHSLNYKDRLEGWSKNVNHSAVIIKEGAFIGASCIILKGVIIGKESIIAAGAVVSKSIPSGESWGGNPAKFIRKIK